MTSSTQASELAQGSFVAYIEECGSEMYPRFAYFFSFAEAATELRNAMNALILADGTCSVGAVYCQATNTVVDVVGLHDSDLKYVASIIKQMLPLPDADSSSQMEG